MPPPLVVAVEGSVGAVGVDGAADELASVDDDAVVTVAMLPDVRLLRCELRLLPEVVAAWSCISSAIGTGSGSWLVLTLMPQ